MALGINHVMVVHGRNSKARDAMFAFIRSLGLSPIEWEEAVQEAGGGSPFTGNIPKNAIEKAGAVVVLLTADDIARLRPMYVNEADRDDETRFTGQARPNVLIEFGMALMAHEAKTIIVELERTRSISDTWGRNAVRYTGNDATFRATIRSRLQGAGCEVTPTGTDWLHAGGDFKHAIAPTASAAEFDLDRDSYGAYIAEAAPTLPEQSPSTGARHVQPAPLSSVTRTLESPPLAASANPSVENAASKIARRIRRFVSTRASRQANAPLPVPNYDAFDEDYDYLDRLGTEFVHAMAQQEHDDFPARLAADFIFRFRRDVADVHALFLRIGVRDDGLERLLFDEHALTLNPHRPTAPETMIAIADRFDALATKPSPRTAPESATLLARIVARNGSLVDQAAVITVSPEGSGGDIVHADERGVAQLSAPGAPSYTALVAHPDYVGAVAALDLDEDTVVEITMESRDGYSSTIITGGYGEIPGLKGHLNTVGSDDTKSLYGVQPDIAINGGKEQPVRFAINEELTLKDIAGAVFRVRFKFIKNRTSLVLYSRG